MASTYPTTLDNFATNKTNATLTVTDHPAHHNDLADAINKLEAEIGTNPSGAFSSLTAKLDSGIFNLGTSGMLPSATAVNNYGVLNALIGVQPPQGRAVFYIPRGTYNIDCTSAVAVLNKKIKLVGDVGGGTILKCSNESTTGTLKLFEILSNGDLELEDIMIQGPTLIGAGGRFDAIYVNSSSGNVKSFNTIFKNFTVALRVSSATNWTGKIETYYSTFDGYGSTTQPSQAIEVNSVNTGARGKKVIAHHNIFKNFGMGGSGLYHGIYAYTDWDIDICFNKFESSIGTGFAVHLYDEMPTGAIFSDDQKIIGNQFSPGLTGNGIVCGGRSNPQIAFNAFESTTGPWIIFNGGAGQVTDNHFAGIMPGIDGIVTQAAANGLPIINVSRNRFTGQASSFIAFDDPGSYRVIDNVFEIGSSASIDVSINAGFLTATVRGNLFLDTVGTAHISVQNNPIVLIQNNAFRSTGTCISTNSAGSRMQIYGNDFSQSSGLTIEHLTANTFTDVADNYGTNVITFVPGIPSASNISFPKSSKLVSIGGTTTINSITPTNVGHVVTLKFNAAIFVSDLNNLKIAGGMVADADDILTLICDGVNWYEISRSAN